MKATPFALALVSVVAFLGGTLVPSARTETQAQPQPPKYYLVDYMKVNPGKFEEYSRVERELWKPVHQEYVKKGKKRSWAFYTIQFPSGADEKYDFVTINTFEKFTNIEDPYSDFQEVFQKIYPNMKIDEFSRRTEDSRRLVREELWTLVDHVE